jgi:hypothetical protein
VFTTSDSTRGNYRTRVRDVTLLPGEKVTQVFSPEDGLVSEPLREGQLLIATNQRIISFGEDRGRTETVLVPIEELKGVTVKTGPQSSLNLFQGLLLAVGGIFSFLIVGYWLAGQVNGPNVPIIGIDLLPFLAMVAIVWGAVLIGRYYFAKEDNLVTFQGSNWVFTFPYRGEKAESEVYQLVNTLFANRQPHNGHYPFLWEK